MKKRVFLSFALVFSCGLSLPAVVSAQSAPVAEPDLDMVPNIKPNLRAAPKAAVGKPEPFRLAKDLDGLFLQLKRTNNAKQASRIANAIWEQWFTSDSKSVDLLTGWTRTAIRKRRFGPALDVIDQVIVLRPGYAEGYNQRATLHFMMENYGKSISDIEKTLALEPRHFGALSGLGIILERIDRKKDALAAWSRTLEIYPAMKSAQDAVIRLEEELAGSNI